MYLKLSKYQRLWSTNKVSNRDTRDLFTQGCSQPKLVWKILLKFLGQHKWWWLFNEKGLCGECFRRKFLNDLATAILSDTCGQPFQVSHVALIISFLTLNIFASHSTALDLQRSSLPEVFCEKGVLKHFAIVTGKHLYWNIFVIKLQMKACNFVKKGLQQICFTVKIAKFFRTAFFIEHLRWLLLPIKA